MARICWRPARNALIKIDGTGQQHQGQRSAYKRHHAQDRHHRQKHKEQARQSQRLLKESGYAQLHPLNTLLGGDDL
jgi:hypothetical protein